MVVCAFPGVGKYEVADNLGHTNTKVGENSLLTLRLSEAMLGVFAPGLDGLLVTPERQGNVPGFIGHALKALHGYKTVDCFQLRSETAGELEVILIPAGVHFDFENYS